MSKVLTRQNKEIATLYQNKLLTHNYSIKDKGREAVKITTLIW